MCAQAMASAAISLNLRWRPGAVLSTGMTDMAWDFAQKKAGQKLQGEIQFPAPKLSYPYFAFQEPEQSHVLCMPVIL